MVVSHIVNVSDCPVALPVAMSSRAHCRHNHNTKLTSSEGYISSEVTKSYRVGADDCPWIIEAKAGQRVSISIFNLDRIEPVSTKRTDDKNMLCLRDMKRIKEYIILWMKTIHYPNIIKSHLVPIIPMAPLSPKSTSKLRFALHFRYSIVIPLFTPCANTAQT